MGDNLHELVIYFMESKRRWLTFNSIKFTNCSFFALVYILNSRESAGLLTHVKTKREYFGRQSSVVPKWNMVRSKYFNVDPSISFLVPRIKQYMTIPFSTLCVRHSVARHFASIYWLLWDPVRNVDIRTIVGTTTTICTGQPTSIIGKGWELEYLIVYFSHQLVRSTQIGYCGTRLLRAFGCQIFLQES